MTREEYELLITLLLLDQNVHEIYQWVAMDKDGEIVVYADKPFLDRRMWYCTPTSKKTVELIYKHFGGFDNDFNHKLIGEIKNKDIDWTTTLISIKELLKT